MAEGAEEKIIQILRSASTPLTFDDIVKASGLDNKVAKEVMVKLLRSGLVKGFIQEDSNGKTKAVYIMF